MNSAARRRIIYCLVAGLFSGAVVLGIGGRALMRLLASTTTPEPPRFSWLGTLEVIGAGASWGLITGPLLLLIRRVSWPVVAEGPVLGLVVFCLAVPPFFAFSGFQGSIVAPASFLWLASLCFPALFALHGLLVAFLYRRWRASERARGSLQTNGVGF